MPNSTICINNMEIFQIPAFATESRILHGISSRSGGVSKGKFCSLNLGFVEGDSKENVVENQRRFCESLGFHLDRLVQPIQIHDSNVVYVNTPGTFPETDALISDVEGIFLSIKTADCVPVLLYDSLKQVIGLIHAGWRGVLSNIISKTIFMMKKMFGTEPRDILAGLGPAICECCYEISAEIADQFSCSEVIRLDNRVYLNIIRAVENRLISSGVLPEKLDRIALCTFCNTEKFYSYRRDNGKTGRLMTVIGLRN